MPTNCDNPSKRRALFETPEAINWNYTYSCNFCCAHCYSRAPSYPAELLPIEYRKLACKIVESNVFRVAFGGGEPLVRKDFLDTVTFFGESGVETFFTTNGWFVDDEVAKALADAPLSMVAVSLDSSSRDLHDRIRGQTGSFDHALRAIRILAGRIPRVVASCTIHGRNVNEVRQLVSLCLSIGADEINLKVFRPAGNGLALSPSFQLCSSELNDFQSVVKDLRADFHDKITLYGPESDEGCSCGTTTLTLRPNGDVVICPYGNEKIGNLLSDQLSVIWTRHPAVVARRSGQAACLGTQSSPWPLGGETSPVQEGAYVERLRSRWLRER